MKMLIKYSFLTSIVCSVTFALTCHMDSGFSPILGPNAQNETCVCGSYCAAFQTTDGKYFWGCGCRRGENGQVNNLCQFNGDNWNAGSGITIHCCDGSLCNVNQILTNPLQTTTSNMDPTTKRTFQIGFLFLLLTQIFLT